MANPVVFISYSTQDQTIAGMVCQALEQDHILCWIAPRNVPAGLNAFDAIPKGIEGCTVFVLVLSAHASQSDYVQRELQLALHYKKTIIPLRIEDIHLDGAVNFMLTGVQWLDAFVPPVERHIAALVKRVTAILEAEEQNNPAAGVGDGVVVPVGGNPVVRVKKKSKFRLWPLVVGGTMVIFCAAGLMVWNRHSTAQPSAPPIATAPTSAGGNAPVTTILKRESEPIIRKTAPPTPQGSKPNADVVGPVEGAAAPTAAETPEQLRARAAVLSGQQKMRDQDYVSAENYFQLALNLDPENATAKSGLFSARKALGEN